MVAITDNSIQILISAKDEAGAVFENVRTTLEKTSIAATVTQARLVGMAGAIAVLGGAGVTKLSQLFGILTGIKTTLLDTAPGRTIIDQLKKASEEAVNEVKPLSEVLRTVGAVSEAAFSDARTPLDKFGKRIDEVSAGIAGKLVDRGIGKLLETFPQLSQGLGFIDNLLAKTLLNKGVADKIPGIFQPALKGIFGENLGEGLVEAIKNTPLKGVLDDAVIKQLIGGTAIGALKAQLAGTIGEGVRQGFIFANINLSGLFEQLGKESANEIGKGRPALSGYQFVNYLFGGRMESAVQGAGGTLGKLISKGIGVERIFDQLFSARLGAGAGAESLFAKFLQAPLNRMMRLGIDNIALIPNRMFAEFQNKIPAPLKMAFAFLDDSFKERLQKTVKDTQKFFVAGTQNLFDDAFRSAPERLQKRINEVSKVFSQVSSVERSRQQQGEIARSTQLDDLGKSKALLILEDELKTAEAAQAKIDKLNRKRSSILARPEELQKQKSEIERTLVLSPEFRTSELTRLNKEIEAALDDVNLSPVQKLQKRITEAFNNLIGSEQFQAVQKAVVAAVGSLKGVLGNVATLAVDLGQALFDELGANAGKAFTKGFVEQAFTNIAPTIDRIDKFVIGVVNKLENLPAELATPFEAVSKGAGYLAGVSEPLEVFAFAQQKIQGVFGAVSAVGEQIFFLQSGLQTLQQVVTGGPFDLLVGQNIRLQEQLLSTQTSLVSTNKIINAFTGMEFPSPKEAILSLTGPVTNAIEDIRRKSLDLVGITSSQLIEPFQIIAGQASQVGINLGQAADLTVSFAAAMGTLGIPMFQARQEISSILQGTIDQNSVLAKTLSISNDQVRSWKSQGTLFEELTKRLEAFRAGNELAAQTIGGISSNIMEVIQLASLAAGQQLMAPIVAEMTTIYEALKANFDAIKDTITKIVGEVFTALKSVYDAIKGAAEASAGIAAGVGQFLIDSLVAALKATANAINLAVSVFRPFIDALAAMLELARPIGGGLLQIAVQASVLSGGIRLLGDVFGMFVKLVPFASEALFLINVRMLPLLNTLPSLTGMLGLGAGGFLALGQSLGNIPGAMGLATKALQGMVGPLAPLIAGMIPTIASAGISIIGLAKVFPPLGTAIQGILAMRPDRLFGLISTAIAASPFAQTVPGVKALAGWIGNLGVESAKNFQGMTLSAIATQKFKEALLAARKAAISFIINFGLLAGAIYLAVVAFDKFILKNETVLESIKAIASGIGDMLSTLGQLAQQPAFVILAGAIALVTAHVTGLTVAIWNLVAAQIAAWTTNAAKALAELSAVLAGLGMVQLSNAAASVALGLGDLSEKAGILVARVGEMIVALIQGSAAQAGSAVTATGAATAQAGLATATATGAVAQLGFAAATKAAALALKDFAVSLWLVLAPLAPFIAAAALVVAGIAAIGAIRYSKNAEEAREAVDIYRRQTDRLFDQSIKVAQGLKELREATKGKIEAGIALSPEELEANQKAVNKAKLSIADLEAHINSLKEAQQDQTEEGKKALQSEIDDSERRKKLLEDQINQTIIENKDLEKRGTIAEQLAKKVATAQEAISNPSGDPEKFKAQVQNMIDATQTQMELGLISREEGRARLEALKNNIEVEVDLQVKSRQQIISAYRDEMNSIKNSMELQELSASEARARLKKIASETKDNKELQIATRQEIIATYKEEQDALERKQQKAMDLLSESENARLIEAKKEFNRTGDRIALQQAELDAARDRNKEEIAQEQEKQKELQAILADKEGVTGKDREAYEAQLRASKLKTQDLIIAAIDNEGQQYDLILERRKAQLEEVNRQVANSIEEQNQKLQAQLHIYQLIEQAMAMQQKLLESRKDLASAANNYIQAGIEILQAGEASEFRKQKLAEAAAAIRLKALEVQQKYELESLALAERQNQLALEREKAENRIAQLKQIATIAETSAELEIAKADKRTKPSELKAIELKLSSQMQQYDLLTKQGQLINEQAAASAEIAANQRRGVLIRQRTERLQTEGQLVETIASPGQKRRAQQVLADKTARDMFGASGRKDAFNQLRSLGQDVISEELPEVGRTASSIASNFDPALEDLSQVLSPEQFAAAAAGAAQQIQSAFGYAPFAQVAAPVPTAPPAKLPIEFYGTQPTGVLGAERPESMLQSIYQGFSQPIEVFGSYVDKLAKLGTGSNTYQITVHAEKTVTSKGTAPASEEEVNIENVIRQAKQLVKKI
jgi:hypothetical protein